MIFMLVKRNYQIQYAQTLLGPVWILINPILSTGLFSFIFGYVGKFDSDGLPYFLFYMSASILWEFFRNCVNTNSRVFMENAYLFGKVYFPRLVMPVSNVVFELVRFMLQLIVCFGAWLFFLYKGQASFTGAYLLLLPVLILQSGLLGMSIGCIISSVTTKYRDLVHFVSFGIQLLMYASPVLYPLSQLPVFLQRLVLLNPMASVLEAFRFCITGSGTIHWGALCYSMAFTAAVVLLGLVMFNRTEKDFIDII